MTTFDKIFPFTTEDISGYMPYLDIKNKSVFTVVRLLIRH